MKKPLSKKKPLSSQTKAIAKVKKKPSGFRLNIRSRHPSHSPLKRLGVRLPFRSVVRFGSDWTGDGNPRVECNSVEAVKTSANKLLMKRAFSNINNNVVTADWYTSTNGSVFRCLDQGNITLGASELTYPIVAKHVHGSRGEGNYLLKTQAELTSWLHGKTLQNYIFEKFYDYSREYRLHVTKDGCFYSCRKMLKEETPKENRWFRNDSNSVWIKQFDDAGKLKSDFDQPVNWKAIVAESVKALEAVGLDIGAIDVRVQSAKDKKGVARKDPKFIILETNSAPSFGDVTLEKYEDEVPRVLLAKRRKVIAR